ncbi:DUF7344 domain-containing protein [Halovivax cerinus]|uniref:DUF308 domain-containing protein n=1 Tax=Halovivax cerinus TaxID=1487865 RepID=A0ABD5NTT5_9EURY|nr:DUF308 domain-containing protein [Halovivax cerinus]
MGSAIRDTHARAGAQPSPDDHLTEGELFELLANKRRRHILHALVREDEPLEIGTLSQEIAAWEDGLDYEEVSSSDRKRVYTALQQSHLPKLDKSGVVSFDRERGTVTPTPALEDVEIYMDVVHGRDHPWSDYYLGLAVFSGLVITASALSVFPFSVLPPYGGSVFAVVSFGVFALAHRFYSRRSRLGIDEDPIDIGYEGDRP